MCTYKISEFVAILFKYYVLINEIYSIKLCYRETYLLESILNFVFLHSRLAVFTDSYLKIYMLTNLGLIRR